MQIILESLMLFNLEIIFYYFEILGDSSSVIFFLAICWLNFLVIFSYMYTLGYVNPIMEKS